MQTFILFSLNNLFKIFVNVKISDLIFVVSFSAICVVWGKKKTLKSAHRRCTEHCFVLGIFFKLIQWPTIDFFRLEISARSIHLKLKLFSSPHSLRKKSHEIHHLFIDVVNVRYPNWDVKDQSFFYFVVIELLHGEQIGRDL